MNLQEHSHKRYNWLTEEWVQVSPHRAKRPWQGQTEDLPPEHRPSYDPTCYLCPGNTRASGDVNPDYPAVFSFVNDFSALQEHSPEIEVTDGLFKARGERGICKVICFSPDHSKSLADMSVEEILSVVELWRLEYRELGSLDFINHVQIFENKGAIMGCSNPHPHGQIWSQSTLPNEAEKKDRSLRRYFGEHGRSLLTDYLEQELDRKERILYTNASFVILVPFWAIWPFETMIVPLRQQRNILEMDEEECRLFAQAVSVITAAYDRIFNTSFPYSSGIHQAPTHGGNLDHWHWHMSFYPPLLRSATVKKFMVGYEMFGSPQRDITAEQAADRIRSLISQ